MKSPDKAEKLAKVTKAELVRKTAWKELFLIAVPTTNTLSSPSSVHVIYSFDMHFHLR